MYNNFDGSLPRSTGFPIGESKSVLGWSPFRKLFKVRDFLRWHLLTSQLGVKTVVRISFSQQENKSFIQRRVSKTNPNVVNPAETTEKSAMVTAGTLDHPEKKCLKLYALTAV
jgi:hypothetical protein